jgi:uncharacterized repeat protein (TIGR01451 family)
MSWLNHLRRTSPMLVAIPLIVFGARSSGSTATAQAAGADLQVTLAVSPLSGVGPTGKVTYTATVVNSGPAAASGATLAVTLPQGVIPVSASPSACTFAPNGTGVTCALGTIAASAPPSTATIVVHPVTTGTKTAIARVSSATPDPLPGNNTATVSSTLTEVGISNLAVTLTDTPDPIRVGQTLVYYVKVHNIQDDTARDVVLIDTLPAGVIVLSAAASQGACAVAGNTVTCSLGSINPGPAFTVEVKIAVRPTVAGLLYNTVGVGLSTVDPDTSNNSATARTWINP